MAYEVTATRKRPQVFNELIGQEFVVSTLQNSISSGRVAHAYLFSGPRGVGKTSAARLLAKALNCGKGAVAVSCGECSSCLEIQKGNSLDVLEIDGASNTSVNDIREIKDEVLFPPNSSRYKIYIIDEVHMLSNSAFNALLKTIEEPPPYIIFIFATTEIHKVPATIRSRCQQFNFRLIPIDLIKAKLADACRDMGIEAEKDALFWIAKEATGSLRDGYTLLDQVAAFSDKNLTLEKIQEKLGVIGFERINRMAEALADNDPGQVLQKCDEIMDQGVAVEQFIVDLTEFFRALLFLQSGIKRENLLGYPVDQFSEKAVAGFSRSRCEMAVSLLLDLYRDIRYSLNQRLELELVLCRIAGLADYLTPSQIIKAVAALKADLAGGRFVTDDYEGEASEDEPAPEYGDPQNAGDQAGAGGEVPVIQQADSTPDGTALKNIKDDPEGLKDALLKGLKGKLTLSSALENAREWVIKGNEIRFIFENAYSANLVRGETAVIARCLGEITGQTFSVKVNTEESDAYTRSDDEQVEMVKKVFRGEVIKGVEE